MQVRDSIYGHRESKFIPLPAPGTDEIARASIFPPRTGSAEEIPPSVRHRLGLELGMLLADLRADETVDVQKAPHATDTYDVVHTYTTLIARRSVGIVAWLGESFQPREGQEVHPADSLSLNSPSLPPEVGQGYFIFRDGQGFGTEGNIDFHAPTGGVCEHEGGEPGPVVAATASQLVALTTELIVLNQTP